MDLSSHMCRDLIEEMSEYLSCRRIFDVYYYDVLTSNIEHIKPRLKKLIKEDESEIIPDLLGFDQLLEYVLSEKYLFYMLQQTMGDYDDYNLDHMLTICFEEIGRRAFVRRLADKFPIYRDMTSFHSDKKVSITCLDCNGKTFTFPCYNSNSMFSGVMTDTILTYRYSCDQWELRQKSKYASKRNFLLLDTDPVKGIFSRYTCSESRSGEYQVLSIELIKR